MNKTVGIVVAGTAAALILSGVATARADEKSGGDVYCQGINSCKGQGTCAGAGNSCAGENSCKGKGIIKSTEKECKDKGGTVVPNPMGK